ncbi:MAG: transglycosylase SLT domain-containing protein [Gemmatimonadota bacterium]|nr:transglycosylase SLT domain-containing protein [Gemmatimonadota bacterium]
MRRTAVAIALLLAIAHPLAGQDAGGGRRVSTQLRKVGRALDSAATLRQSRHTTERYDPIFRKYTKRYFGVGTDWRYFKAQGMAESDLTPTARSRVGARGIMQLMPSTYGQIQSALPQFGAIDNPEWNIAAGILHDRDLWTLWKRDVPGEERWRFMFAGYNAGEGTIMRARRTAVTERLEDWNWQNIVRVAPRVERWRYAETVDYVRRIEANHRAMSEPELSGPR